MTVAVELPLIASQQTLSVTLNGVQYQLRLTWNPPAEVWLMDVSDPDGVAIAQGIALTAGADLLEQLEYLELGGAIVTATDSDLNIPPSQTNLGDQGHVYFLTP